MTTPGPALYHLADVAGHEHVHGQCRECGRIIDQPDGVMDVLAGAGRWCHELPRAELDFFRQVRGRSIPKLAMLSAFSFLIMMCNLPVPGGTSAQSVEGLPRLP